VIVLDEGSMRDEEDEKARADGRLLGVDRRWRISVRESSDGTASNLL
jgi:hypothetical protein